MKSTDLEKLHHIIQEIERIIHAEVVIEKLDDTKVTPEVTLRFELH